MILVNLRGSGWGSYMAQDTRRLQVMSFDLIEQPTDNVRYECEECGTHNPNKHESWCAVGAIGSWSDEYIG